MRRVGCIGGRDDVEIIDLVPVPSLLCRVSPRNASAAKTPATTTAESITSTTPARWLSTPVWSKPQITTESGVSPGGVTKFVAGNSPSASANETPHAAITAARVSGNATPTPTPHEPRPSTAAASR